MAGLEAIIDRMANVGNAAETAYAVLREAIVTNTLKPGTRLRADDLAKTAGRQQDPRARSAAQAPGRDCSSPCSPATCSP